MIYKYSQHQEDEFSEEGNSRHSPGAYSAQFSAFLKVRSLSRSTHSCGMYHYLPSSSSPFTGLYKCIMSCTTTANCDSVNADPSFLDFLRPNRPTTARQSSRWGNALSDQKFGHRATTSCIGHAASRSRARDRGGQCDGLVKGEAAIEGAGCGQ